MASKADYMKAAKQIADHMNAFKLAFKTYKVSDFDDMIKAICGAGARVSTSTTSQEFTALLQERGFIIYPALSESPDGFVRVYRANSVIASLLSALRYPGEDGDSQLASLLRTLQVRRRPDDFSPPEAEV